MPWFLKGNCVWSGTKDDPGEEVKCHESREEATAHLKALYANVDEDSKRLFVDVEGKWYEFVREKGGEDATLKGGPGSGWHRPPQGTHNAENAPNFRGGPGADRTYGTESDEPPEGTKLCKCTKCDSTFTLPKGKQCEDVKCPGCGGGATQTSPRKDKPAEGEGGRGGGSGKKDVECPACEEEAKAMDGPDPQVHGEGGSLGEVASVGDTDSNCKCPHCGEGLPCSAKACPHCKKNIDKVERGEDGKKANIAYAIEKGVSYKGTDGTWRWMAISNWAVIDKEQELVSEGAYRDAIKYAQQTGDYGQLDLVHIEGTDRGDADMLFILKGGDGPPKLGASGPWHDTEIARKNREVIQANPEFWGMSLKFRFDPSKRVHGVYTGGIQILKHSVLPQQMAASYGTAIAVQGGEMSKQLDEKAAEALRQLGHTEDQISELAEKQKALPQEENVVEKEESTQEQPAGAIEKLYRSLGKVLGLEPTAAPDASPPDEARKAKEVAEPAQETGPVEKQAEGDEPEPDPGDTGEIVKALSEAIVPVMGAMVQKQLDERDKRIADLEEMVKALGTDIETKVEQRLADMPPITKVAASSVVAPADAPALGVGPMSNQAWKSAMRESIEQATKDTLSGQRYQS
jgi:hypothetical protein